MYVGAYLILGPYPAKTVLPDCQTGILDISLSFPILNKNQNTTVPTPKLSHYGISRKIVWENIVNIVLPDFL